jgi:hypothetical protein
MGYCTRLVEQEYVQSMGYCTRLVEQEYVQGRVRVRVENEVVERGRVTRSQISPCQNAYASRPVEREEPLTQS